MLPLRLKLTVLPRYLPAPRTILFRNTHLLRLYPVAQARWSSATTEPRQPDGDGGTQGPPSSQKQIKYTSES